MDNTENNVKENVSQIVITSETPNYPYGNTDSDSMSFKKKEEKKIELSKKDYIFFGIFAVLSVCLVFFGFFNQMALGFTVSAIALIGAMTVYIAEKESFTVVSVSSLVIAVLSSIVFTLYGDDLLTRFIAFLILFTSTVLCTMSLCDEAIADTASGIVKMIYGTVVSPFKNLVVPVKAVFRNDKKKTTLQILAALLAAGPVLAIVIPLLVSSDAAFEGLVSKAIEALGMTIVKIIVSIIVFVILLSFVVANKFNLNEHNSKIDLEKSRFIKSPFSTTFLGLIAFVYLVYMFSQTAYFFSAFSGILPAGYEFSFAEYARRGFFETEAIAFINLILMTLAMWLTVRCENGDINPVVKGIITFISIFTVLLIITAISKMVMYIGAYGLTVLRLFTSVFMLATAVVIIAFIIRVFNPELKTMKYAALISMALFTVLCLCGIDRTVADYNVNEYLDGRLKGVDIETLYQSSDSAIPYIAKLTECDDEDISAEAQGWITRYYRYYVVNTDEAIRVDFEPGVDFTVSEYLAAKAINSRQIKPYEDFVVDEPVYEIIEDEYVFDEDEALSWD